MAKKKSILILSLIIVLILFIIILTAVLNKNSNDLNQIGTDNKSQTVHPIISFPPSALKIVALGDSLTEGMGDDDGLGYPERLLAQIKTLRPDSTMSNLGKSGWTSSGIINGTNGLPSQLNAAITQDPDIALVWIGSNDLWYLYEYDVNTNNQNDVREIEALNLEEYQNNINTILSRLRENDIIVFIALLDDQSKRPVASDKSIRDRTFSSLTTHEIELMSRQVKQYNQIIRDSAGTYGAFLVDFYNTDIFTTADTLYSDGNHPNSAGYEMIADKWFSEIQKIEAD